MTSIEQSLAYAKSVKKQLEAISQVSVDALGDRSKHGAFRARFDVAKQMFRDFQNCQKNVKPTTADQSALLDEWDSLVMEINEIYFTISSINFEIAESKKAAELLSSTCVASPKPSKNVKLPPLELRAFNGDIRQYSSFIELFSSLIGSDDTLSEVEKFMYLKGALQGEALSLVQSLSVTGANYAVALQTLETRYSNTRLIASNHFDAIYAIKPASNRTPQVLRAVLDTFNANYEALEALQLSSEQQADFVWLNLLLQKLDSETRERFEVHQQDSKEIPSLKSLKAFVENQCRALELANSSQFSVKTKVGSLSKFEVKHSNYKSKTIPPSHSFVTNTNMTPCPLCQAPHSLFHCSEFASKTPQARFEIAKRSRLCLNCLKNSHQLKNCSSKNVCKSCGSKHHTLLHFSKRESVSLPAPKAAPLEEVAPVESKETVKESNSSDVAVNTFTVRSNSNNNRTSSLLSTALIHVLDAQGNYQPCRALIDSGSQANFISESFLQILGIKRRSLHIPIYGLNNMQTRAKRGAIVCTVKSRFKDEPVFRIEAIVMSQICQSLPAEPISPENGQHVAHLVLADPDFATPARVDLLLGVDIFSSILLDGRIKINDVSPVAINTVFGWLLMGPTRSLTQPLASFCTILDNAQLDSLVRKFWELEQIPNISIADPDEVKAETSFQETHRRNEAGRYIVSLPFRDVEPVFFDSREIALRRFKSLEHRLSKNPELCKLYSQFMNDYLDSGHMEVVPPSSSLDSNRIYYIPHHCVLKPDSPTTQLRVVFDASCRDSNGLSLNDTLLPGPKLQKDINTLLLDFRCYPIVFTADIKQMFRQIMLSPSHQDYQRIVWRFTPDSPVQDFRLKTVSFGVSSSPFLANRTLQQLAEDEGAKFPLAAEVLRSSIYVDDIITGCNSIQEAITLQKQLIALLKLGGFELRKWSSNSSQFLAMLPEEVCQTPQAFDNHESFPIVKILGLRWNPNSDSFSFHVKPSESTHCTKRLILSDLARIFDPQGFLAPLTLFAKQLIQQLWIIGVGWDDTPPESIVSLWFNFRHEMSQISRVEIPRLVLQCNASYQLHGFSDASESGYSAVIYLRSAAKDREIRTFLVAAKSKVAPLKRLSIPRLELCAAALLAELLDFVVHVYQKHITFEKVRAWTDSSVVLHWIRSLPHRWKPFVSHRIALIQEKLPINSWNYVKSQENPADPASRGLSAADLVNCSIWWAGPHWLQTDSDTLSSVPSLPSDVLPEEVEAESKPLVLVSQLPSDPIHVLLHKFSLFRKIERIVAFCRRFCHNSRHEKGSENRLHGPLSQSELYEARVQIVKVIQHQVFAKEIELVKEQKTLAKPLRQLALFLDSKEALRVGGRLRQSSLNFDAKHPLLLPQKHRLTELIIEHFHKAYLHPGAQTLHSLLAQQFWILAARRVIRSVISRCNRCFRAEPRAPSPLMGDLPVARVNQVKPFTHVGTDFAGPFEITLARQKNAKRHKAYICIFVCLAVKAIHLELVSSLSSDAFLAAFRRFVARRGQCLHMYSDQGTNFIGANRLLRSYLKDSAESLAIRWHFNPPSSPHFGGLWEAGVRSVKRHFNRLVTPHLLTYEELLTMLVQIEGVLNSRPLCAISTNPHDLEALTPGHFLTLAPLTCPPDENLESIKENRLSRWQLIQQCHQHFWRRWHSEYLHTLQQRAKWNKPSTSLSVGTLVVIKDDLAPPLRWRLARIQSLHPGPDGISRVATVRTQNGVMQRPIIKLCPLPNQ